MEDYMKSGGHELEMEPGTLLNKEGKGLVVPTKDGGGITQTSVTQGGKRGLFLNLFSTFLYMTNYYIVGPTSNEYMVELGGHEALAGILIGAMPWAAMFSAIGYR